jgi:hypothetical protein
MRLPAQPVDLNHGVFTPLVFILRSPERVAIDRARDEARESALHFKAGADAPDWRIAEGEPTQPGSGLAAAFHLAP